MASKRDCGFVGGRGAVVTVVTVVAVVVALALFVADGGTAWAAGAEAGGEAGEAGEAARETDGKRGEAQAIYRATTKDGVEAFADEPEAFGEGTVGLPVDVRTLRPIDGPRSTTAVEQLGAAWQGFLSRVRGWLQPNDPFEAQIVMGVTAVGALGLLAWLLRKVDEYRRYRQAQASLEAIRKWGERRS